MAGRDIASPGCPQCRELQRQLQAALVRIQELEQQVRELQARLDQNSSNSSRPPSSDPPWFSRRSKKPSGRSPGGQPGHPGHFRPRLPPEQVDQVVHSWPQQCRRCHRFLPHHSPDAADPPPHWRQVAELPPRLVQITEYQAHGCSCPQCGAVTYAAFPATLPQGVLGPRLSALISYFGSRGHLSKRQVQEVVQSVLGVPLGLGTVCAREAEMKRALARPYQQVQQQVRQAPVKQVDETPWQRAGQGCWLWMAATAQAVLYRIDPRRSRRSLQRLLGSKPAGTLVSDRLSVYHLLPRERRQVCWAHLRRDFEALRQRGLGLGKKGLAISDQVFALWRALTEGSLSRSQMQEQVKHLQKRLRNLLLWWAERPERGRGSRFAQKLLDLGGALWHFGSEAGVPPDNNHAERLLRPAVLWRKGSFGCQSRGGCRFVERILTVVGTLRLQGHNVLEFLEQILTAYRSDQPPPAILPTNH